MKTSMKKVIGICPKCRTFAENKKRNKYYSFFVISEKPTAENNDNWLDDSISYERSKYKHCPFCGRTLLNKKRNYRLNTYELNDFDIDDEPIII